MIGPMLGILEIPYKELKRGKCAKCKKKYFSKEVLRESSKCINCLMTDNELLAESYNFEQKEKG